MYEADPCAPGIKPNPKNHLDDEEAMASSPEGKAVPYNSPKLTLDPHSLFNEKTASNKCMGETAKLRVCVENLTPRINDESPPDEEPPEDTVKKSTCSHDA